MGRFAFEVALIYPIKINRAVVEMMTHRSISPTNLCRDSQPEISKTKLAQLAAGSTGHELDHSDDERQCLGIVS